MSRFLLSLVLVCSVALAACAPTQVVIVVTADSEVTLAGVRSLQFITEGSNGGDDPFRLTGDTPVTQGIRFPYRFVVERLGDSRTRRYAVTLLATLEDGRVVRAQRISTYVNGEVRQIYMHLEESCAGDEISCATFGFTCSGGECVSAMVEPSEIPPLGADASEDAPFARLDGAVDAPMDAGIALPDANHDAFLVPDAGVDAWSEFDTSEDAALPPDVGLDAGSDAGTDAGSDAGTDAFSSADAFDAGRDAGTDAFSSPDAFDAGRDAGMDAGSDAGRDAGVDAHAPFATDARDATDVWTPPDASSSVVRDAPLVPGADQLFINEVDYQGSDDFIEFYNGTAAPIDLGGYQLVVLNSLCAPTLVTAPFLLGSIVEAGGVYSVRPGDIPLSPSVRLIGPGAFVVDSVSFRSDSGCEIPYAGVTDIGDPDSAQRYPDGDSAWVLSSATPGSSNSH